MDNYVQKRMDLARKYYSKAQYNKSFKVYQDLLNKKLDSWTLFKIFREIGDVQTHY
ncbi:hypothetical protein ES703_52501 [subsurface metagenome]